MIKKPKKVQMERAWSMPSRWTFTIPPIAKLLKEEITGLIADPFAGKNSPAQEQNDIDEECGNRDASHEDALIWLKGKRTARYDTVLFDPPYSITQARMYGKKEFASMKYWRECKDEIARILKPGGKAICFGWSSMGLGKNRGFEMKRILLVTHGGSRNDTICTVEIKK
jgi:hypothetical protein